MARILEEAQATDAAEDARDGAGRRGDAPPPGPGDPTRRLQRLRAARRRLEDGHRQRRAGHATRLAARAARERATGKGSRGRRPQAPRPRPQAKANTTDPDSRVVKTSLGHLQGYNAQALVAEGQIVLAAELSDNAAAGCAP